MTVLLKNNRNETVTGVFTFGEILVSDFRPTVSTSSIPATIPGTGAGSNATGYITVKNSAGTVVGVIPVYPAS